MLIHNTSTPTPLSYVLAMLQVFHHEEGRAFIGQVCIILGESDVRVVAQDDDANLSGGQMHSKL